MLTLQAKPQLEAQAQAAAQDQIFYGVSPHVDAVLFTDFIVAQVKVFVGIHILRMVEFVIFSIYAS